MKSEEILRLVVIDDSSNYAEIVSNILRNAGHAVRAERVEDDEDLRNALKEQSCDMVLSKPEIPYFSAHEALDILNQLNPQMPFIIITDKPDDEKIIVLLKSGASDVVNIEQPERLTHALLREYHNGLMRQRLAMLEKDMQHTNQRAQMLVDNSRDAIAYVHEGMHIYANHSYLEMFGYTEMDEIEGMPLMNMVTKDDHEKFKKYLRDYSKGKAESETLEVTALRLDGDTFNITMEFTPAFYEGEPCTQIIIRNQIMSRELEKKLDDMAKIDLLSGAYNRQYFLELLNNSVGKPNLEGAMFAIELDKYQEIRDSKGISAADRLLAEFATLAVQFLPGERDIVCRFEGQRFTALLFKLDKDGASAIADKMVKQVNDHIFELDGQTATTSCSIGIGLFNEGIKSPQEVISRAERALKTAMDAGGNRHDIYQPAEKEMADTERATIIGKQIKEAIQKNRLCLHYAPIISLHGDINENYEAYLRLIDEEGNETLPSDFFKGAEASGLMVAVDRWVVANAIKTIVVQRKAGKPLSLFVKLSSTSVSDDKFLPWMRDLIRAARLEPYVLTIEMAESSVNSNLKAVKVMIEGLKQLRVRFAMEHVGQVPNYINLLKHINADILKLDADLCRTIAKDPESMKKIREVVDHAKSNDKLTVAVAVEDPQTLATMFSSGVDYIQGPFIQPPSKNLNFDFSSME